MNQDWEHEHLKDEMYLLEAHKQMEVEWQMWEEEQHRKPAKIKILTPLKTKQKNEIQSNSSSFRGTYKKKL